MKDFKNISDQAFDDLFRESAEQMLPDFDESAWEKMEVMLDDPGPDKGGFLLKKPLIYSAIIALFLSMAYFTYDRFYSESSVKESTEVFQSLGEIQKFDSKPTGLNNLPRSESQKQALINQNSIKPSNIELKKDGIREAEVQTNELVLSGGQVLKSNGIINERGNTELEENEFDATVVIAIATENGSIQTSENSTLASKNRKPISQINVTFLNEKVEKTGSPMLIKGEKKPVSTSIERSIGEEKGTSQYLNSQNQEAVILERGVGDVSEPIVFLGQENVLSETDLTKTNTVTLELSELASLGYTNFIGDFPLPSIEGVAPELKMVEQENRLSLRLAISPDFSSVPENNFFKIGHNWAALLEYRIDNRWSLQTGVIKSLKYYTAGPFQYRWPATWGERPLELDHVDARCNMLDIPVNVRYDFTQGRNRWFAQGGLTSYLMLNEKYDYVYAEGSTVQKWNKWEGKTGFYAAGVANLSFGLEKKLGRRLSFQAEPFAKIPLRKVGFGNVKLATLGVFFSSKIALVR